MSPPKIPPPKENVYNGIMSPPKVPPGKKIVIKPKEEEIVAKDVINKKPPIEK